MSPRVLFLGSSGDLYGAPRVLCASASALVRAGMDVVVAVPSGGPLVPALKFAGAEVAILPDFALRRRNCRLSAAASFIRSQLTLLRWAAHEHQRASFDLVYTHTQSVIAGPVIALRLGVPHVWHVHEILRSPALLARALAWLAWIGSAVIVCPSRAAAANLQRLAAPAARHSVVVYNSLDATALSQLAVPERGESLRVGCIARLHPGKGQDIAIAATASARSRGIPVTLRFYGEPVVGNEYIEDQLRAEVQSWGICDAVEFAGFIADPIAIYGDLDVVIIPSTVPESFSLACLEAQIAARPVIASDAGGPSELLLDRETGILVTPGSATALADALEYLWNAPEQVATMGRRGRAHVLGAFSMESFENGVLAVVGACIREDT